MTNAEARFSNSLRPRKPEGSLGRTAQDVHLDSDTAPELCNLNGPVLSLISHPTSEDIKNQRANCPTSILCNRRAGPRVRRLIKELAHSVRELHLWAAGLTSSDEDVPPELLPQPLDTPLRSAPVIQREVAKGFHQFQVNDYGNSGGIPAPGDGPNVVRLSHAGAGHEGRWPVSCHRCGQEVAAELRRLGVGAEGEWPGLDTR